MGKARSTRQPTNQPERKIGPFSGGISVAIWINEIDTDQGARKVRSVTISPRRYRDADGEWHDTSGYRPGDLPALIFALEKAQEYMYTTPLPNSEDEDGSF